MSNNTQMTEGSSELPKVGL